MNTQVETRQNVTKITVGKFRIIIKDEHIKVFHGGMIMKKIFDNKEGEKDGRGLSTRIGFRKAKGRKSL